MNFKISFVWIICLLSCKNTKFRSFQLKRLGPISFSSARETTSIPRLALVAHFFGAPKPLHFSILHNWSHLPIDFHLIVDQPALWKQDLQKPNFYLYQWSIAEYLQKVEKIIGTQRFNLLRIQPTGWYTCSFRPLSPLLLPVLQKYQYWGWIDWDVFISKSLLSYLQQQDSSINVFLTPPLGVHAIDHIKIFKNGDYIPEKHFLEALSQAKLGFAGAMENEFAKYVRSSTPAVIDKLSVLKFARHYDEKLSKDHPLCQTLGPVVYHPMEQTLHSATHDLLFLVADIQIKETTDVSAYQKQLESCEPIVFKVPTNILCSQRKH